MIGRIVRPADFERVLATPPCSRSTHFAVHHVAGRPSLGRAAASGAAAEQVVRPVSPQLSTDSSTPVDGLVDESSTSAAEGRWLGLVVPKRHAKRAVTRNLIKRQIRSAMALEGERLAAGLWVVRLRLPFDKRTFTSPASDALREAARAEIGQLFARAAVARGAAA